MFLKIRSEKSTTGGYCVFLKGYAQSPLRGFESNLENVVCLDEDDIQLLLKQHDSYFNICELYLSIYSIKDISEAVYTKGDREGTIRIEYDDTSMKTKLVLTRFGLTFVTLKFHEKSF